MVRFLTPFKILALVNVAAVLVQAVTAGQLLSGGGKALHGMGAGAVHAAGLLLLIVGVLMWRPGRGPGGPALAALVILLVGFVQSATGGSGVTALHVPLGMTIMGLSVWLAVWAFTPSRSARSASS
ncbi:hypothetical protein AB0B45_18740 [Nonomuraea sp. NPDC049152]|uniref:hypothetical protein n=1 Tax=Nonomuraea sp. NPDC049152 TaxID=3154350 RepID=UPI0033EF67EF